MRRTKRFASFALAACMGVSLLVNVPVGTVVAAEPDENVTAPVEGMTEETVSDATGTDAEALDENQETVYYDTSDADEDGFVWLGTTIVKYVGEGGDVKIPEKCTSIADYAFSAYWHGTLTGIEIPSGVTSIGKDAFASWLSGNSLEKIVVDPENENYNSDNACNAIIETKTNKLILGCKNTKIPQNVTSIGDDAFVGCSGLTSIEIPESVTSIGWAAFRYCSGLTNIEIPAGVTSIGGVAFQGCNALVSVSVSPANETYNSNGGCNAIIETKTNTLIFGCKNTKIPEGVMRIGDHAFSYCIGLTSIEIPESVKCIEDGAFYECRGLTSVGMPVGVTYIGEYAFYECENLTNIKIPTSVTRIENGSFQASGLKSVEIPEGVTSIEYYAFSECRNLANVVLPDGLERIGLHAFFYCDSLKEIKIPTSVTSIERAAFAWSTELTSIEIPKGVACIEDDVFFGCSGLTDITIPESVTEIGNSAFDGCDNLKTIYGYTGSYAETYAKEKGYTFKAIEEPVADVTTSYRTHVQSFGWQNPVTNGVMSGTSGKAKRLEGIEISVSGNKNLGIQYSTHCQTYGWLPWSANGGMNGTTGEAKRLEAIKIQLTGADKDKYDVYYRVHAQSYGWLGWAKNGEPSGTAGYAKRLEGIQIVVVKKTEAAPGLDYAGVNASKGVHDSRAYIAKTNGAIAIPGSTDSTNIMYKTHVQSFGWQNWVLNGDMSGTSGKAKRLEGINIKLSNAAYAGGIQYRTHVQTYGWEKEWKKDGAMSGTSGEAKRLEAIQIKLYGEMANHFDVYYRVHAQSYGWLGWAKNGEESGTAGFAKRLEGIQIVLVPKGGAAPANNYKGIQSVNTKAYIKK